MYVNKNINSAGRIVLAYYEGYRDKDGKPKQRHIKRIGFLDELEKIYDDPITHFKMEARRLTQEKQETDPTSLNVTLDMNLKTPVNETLTKNLGYVFLQSVYSSLKLPEFFKNKQRTFEVEYNLNNIVRLLTFSRILKPAPMYFEKLAPTKDSVYDALTRLAPLQNELQIYLHENVKALYGRTSELSCFYCTNYYFEIESKSELRKKEPFIQMGLLMDSNGIPMVYHLFPSNESDKINLHSIVNRYRLEYNLNRIIVVVDSELNTSDNIFYTHGKDDGYVYSQSIRSASSEYKEWIISDDDYVVYENHNDSIRKDDKICVNAFKIKSRVVTKTITINEDGKRNDKVSIKQKQVAYYSSKYAKRQRLKRNEAIEKAEKYINEEKYDGYYSIVTSEWNLSDLEIINIYRGLWKIEESFEITKSELCTYPVYLSNEQLIQSHFFICFLALLILRIIEHETQHKYSTHELIEAMHEFNYTLLADNLYQCLNRHEAINLLDETFSLDTTKYRMTLGKIKKIIATSKK